MRHLMILLAVPLCSLLMTSRPADAANLYRTVYKVEVEYWFFDTDYSYWSTILETTDRQEAQLMYELLEYAHENGDLNSVVPNSYGRYIAIDVRLRTEYDLIAPPLRWESDLLKHMNLLVPLSLSSSSPDGSKSSD
ncbi:MAG: hypothetical protein ACF8PG_12415 [Maioricimonas sp. JB045]|uniref:hypothetical protein n=1 Tax=Maioricimonas sp. JC845 TaxID=3232138 RepID=UPI003458128E